MSGSLFVLSVQVLLICFLISFMIITLKLSKIMQYEKRIDKYTINSITTDENSFFGELFNLYYKYRRNLANRLSKNILFKGMDKRYEKYTNKDKLMPDIAYDFVADKVITAVLFLIIVVVSNALLNSSVTLYQMLLSVVIGYFAPDILLYSNNKIKNKNMENDLLKAITIMNNSFKSGNSIMQAIKIVTEELDGPLKDEFMKMYIDLSYGLGLDIVFKRFSKRVNNDEVNYMTTSLTILNKTGGNVAKVFSSIENSFFERRKLKQEMKSVKASSDFMFKILVFIPFAISLFIVVLNPTYFTPLFTTPIGLLLLFIIVLIYVSYIVIIKKVMKVEGL